MFSLLFALAIADDYHGTITPPLKINEQGEYNLYECFFLKFGDINTDESALVINTEVECTLNVVACTFIETKSKFGGAINIKQNCLANLYLVCFSHCEASQLGAFIMSGIDDQENPFVSLQLSYISAEYGLKSERPICISNNFNATNINLSQSESINTYSNLGAYGVFYQGFNTERFILRYSNFYKNTSPCGIFYSYYAENDGAVYKTNFVENNAETYSVFYAQGSDPHFINMASCLFYNNNLIDGAGLITSQSSIIEFVDENNTFIGEFEENFEEKYFVKSGDFFTNSGYIVNPDNFDSPDIYTYYSTAQCFAVDPYPRMTATPIPSQTPEIPEQTQTQETPEQTQTQETPEQTQTQEIPDQTQAPEIPEQTQAPEMPEPSENQIVPEPSSPFNKQNRGGADKKEEMNWIWIVVAVAAFLVLVAIAIGVYIYKKKSSSTSETIDYSENTEMTTIMTTTADQVVELDVTIDNPLFTTEIKSDDPFAIEESEDPFVDLDNEANLQDIYVTNPKKVDF